MKGRQRQRQWWQHRIDQCRQWLRDVDREEKMKEEEEEEGEEGEGRGGAASSIN